MNKSDYRIKRTTHNTTMNSSGNAVKEKPIITDSVEQTSSSGGDGVSSSRQEASSSQTTTSSVVSSSSEAKSSSVVSSSSEASSSSEVSSSSAALSSSEPYSYSYDPTTGIELRINLFNSTCPTAGSESINDTLAEYINECAEETLVSSISNVKFNV